MKKFTITLLLSLLMVFGLTLTACSSTDYSSQIESLEERVADLENQNETLNEINKNLEDTNKKLNEINANLQNQAQYKLDRLTADNYSDYIAFNPTIIDMYVEKNDNSSYGIYLIGQLTTSSLGDYHFENCIIDYKIEIYDDEKGWETDGYGFVKLDYNGQSESSFTLKNKSIYTIKVLNLSYSRVKINYISGLVLVPKE